MKCLLGQQMFLTLPLQTGVPKSSIRRHKFPVKYGTATEAGVTH